MINIKQWLIPVLVLFLSASMAKGQTQWSKYINNPVLQPGPANWDQVYVMEPSVLFDGMYKMWYSGQSGQYYQIGLASSADGINWIKEAANPVLIPGPAIAWDDAGVRSPSVIFANNVYMMWFTGVTNSIYQIGLATSADGVLWNKSTSNPVLTPDINNAWEDVSVRDPFVFKEGNQFVMYYSGKGSNGPHNIYQIGRAVSIDGINWIREVNNPVLTPGVAPAWDDVYVMDPSVYKDGKGFKMWYAGETNQVFQIGYATSSDGINWIRYDQNPVLTPDPGNPWEEVLVTSPYVFKENNEYIMYFSGKGSNAFNMYQIGRATSLATNIDHESDNANNQFNIYPNPANDIVYVKYPEYNGTVYIYISDTRGRIVLKKQGAEIKDCPVEIDIAGLDSGIYYLFVICNNNIHQEKLLINK